MRKPFNTSIDERISKEFKLRCAENNIPMNTVLELLMKYYCDGKFKIDVIACINDSKE